MLLLQKELRAKNPNTDPRAGKEEPLMDKVMKKGGDEQVGTPGDHWETKQSNRGPQLCPNKGSARLKYAFYSFF